MIRGEISPLLAILESSARISLAFLETFGDDDSPSVGSVQSTPMRLLGLVSPMCLAQDLMVSRRGITQPEPVPPPQPNATMT